MNSNIECIITDIPFTTDNRLINQTYKKPEYSLKLHKEMEQKAEKNMVKIIKSECYPRINSYYRHYIPNINKPWMFDNNNIIEYW